MVRLETISNSAARPPGVLLPAPLAGFARAAAAERVLVAVRVVDPRPAAAARARALGSAAGGIGISSWTAAAPVDTRFLVAGALAAWLDRAADRRAGDAAARAAWAPLGFAALRVVASVERWPDVRDAAAARRAGFSAALARDAALGFFVLGLAASSLPRLRAGAAGALDALVVAWLAVWPARRVAVLAARFVVLFAVLVAGLVAGFVAILVAGFVAVLVAAFVAGLVAGLVAVLVAGFVAVLVAAFVAGLVAVWGGSALRAAAVFLAAALVPAGGAATFRAPDPGAGALRAAAVVVLVFLRLAGVVERGVEGFLAAVFFAGLIAFFATVLGLRRTAG